MTTIQSNTDTVAETHQATIQRILEKYGDAYYFHFSHGDINGGVIQCVMNNLGEDSFQAEGYQFNVDHHRQENINDEDTDPETNGGFIDVPIHDIYTISYKRVAA